MRTGGSLGKTRPAQERLQAASESAGDQAMVDDTAALIRDLLDQNDAAEFILKGRA